MSTVFTLQYGLMKWKDCIGFAFLIITESLQSTPQRKKKREKPICAFIMWLFEATVQAKQGLCLRHLWGPISLSIHLFIGFRRFPLSPPLRGPHLITDHHSHLACVPFQLSAQFLSDDPREPQAHWPRIESPNRSLSHPSHFCVPDADPLPAQSDPEWKADASVACYMTCDIRLTQWHKRMEVRHIPQWPWCAVCLVQYNVSMLLFSSIDWTKDMLTNVDVPEWLHTSLIMTLLHFVHPIFVNTLVKNVHFFKWVLITEII